MVAGPPVDGAAADAQLAEQLVVAPNAHGGVGVLDVRRRQRQLDSMHRHAQTSMRRSLCADATYGTGLATSVSTMASVSCATSTSGRPWTLSIPHTPAPSAATAPSPMAYRAPNCLRDPADDGATDRRAPEEQHRLQREHPSSHLGRGLDLHDRGRRREEGDAAHTEHDSHDEGGPGSARRPSAPSTPRRRATPARRCER